LVARKNGGRTVFTLELLAVLAIWAASLVAARPRMVVHSDPRWIGENVWVGIPVLIALVVLGKLIARIWRPRDEDERKLQRLIHDRLRAEKQERKQELAELQKQAAELTRQAAELKRKDKGEAAELQKQRVQAEIMREERLRDERLGMQGAT
jgi:uncharacterized protein YlxW (UPF0749 family)